MKNSVFEGDIKQCYGCKACEQICNASAITMIANAEGFEYPVIDTDKCTECLTCEKVCPAIESNREKVVHPKSEKTFAAWNLDVVQLMQSSSGAIFPLLVQNILKQGGIVYGCAWNSEKIVAEHIRVTYSEELERLKSSRYVQSNINTTYKQAKEDLKNNHKVLFSGTPCQIAGLKLFLRRECYNLFTVDLLCHGVPSPKLLEMHTKCIEKSENREIRNLRFRDKRKIGWLPWVSWEYKNNSKKKKYSPLAIDPYLFGFYRRYFNRESCYLCKFASKQRAGDITLGDYWGVENYHPELKIKHRYGISAVMCNTEKGYQLYEAISSFIEDRPSTVDNVANHNNLKPEIDRPTVRNTIYQEIQEQGWEKIAATKLRHKHYLIYKLTPSFLFGVIKNLKQCLKK